MRRIVPVGRRFQIREGRSRFLVDSDPSSASRSIRTFRRLLFSSRAIARLLLTHEGQMASRPWCIWRASLRRLAAGLDISEQNNIEEIPRRHSRAIARKPDNPRQKGQGSGGFICRSPPRRSWLRYRSRARRPLAPFSREPYRLQALQDCRDPQDAKSQATMWKARDTDRRRARRQSLADMCGAPSGRARGQGPMTKRRRP